MSYPVNDRRSEGLRPMLVHTCQFDREGRCGACDAMLVHLREENVNLQAARRFVATEIKAGRIAQQDMDDEGLRFIASAIAYGRDQRERLRSLEEPMVFEEPKPSVRFSFIELEWSGAERG